MKFYPQTKRVLDIVLAFLAILILFPFLAGIALIIKMDTKGPVFFKQKRIGKHKECFYIFKFRTMTTETPCELPSHKLDNPEAYITKSGRWLRKMSIDELPQILNIIKGEMSFIGPRPALWNQYDLIKLRDEYGVNELSPGITGLAQINGRDELSTELKAKLDWRYLKELSFILDVKCFFKTIFCVIKRDGIAEGCKYAKKDSIMLQSSDKKVI